jgi:3-phenylpropionate/cinnamic acid dioxygenase small subunit
VDDRLNALERQIQVLIDKDQIRDVLYRYARAVDRKDVELLKSCYHPDSTDAHWTFIGNGLEFAEEILQPHQMGNVPLFKHLITNILIEIEGERAFCESSYLFTQTLAVTATRRARYSNEGRYLDVFERRHGEWRILRRLLVPESESWSFSVPMPPPTDMPRPTREQRAGRFPGDPVYRKFGITEILPSEFRSHTDRWSAALNHLRTMVERADDDR